MWVQIIQDELSWEIKMFWFGWEYWYNPMWDNKWGLIPESLKLFWFIMKNFLIIWLKDFWHIRMNIKYISVKIIVLLNYWVLKERILERMEWYFWIWKINELIQSHNEKLLGSLRGINRSRIKSLLVRKSSVIFSHQFVHVIWNFNINYLGFDFLLIIIEIWKYRWWDWLCEFFF